MTGMRILQNHSFVRSADGQESLWGGKLAVGAGSMKSYDRAAVSPALLLRHLPMFFRNIAVPPAPTFRVQPNRGPARGRSDAGNRGQTTFSVNATPTRFNPDPDFTSMDEAGNRDIGDRPRFL